MMRVAVYEVYFLCTRRSVSICFVINGDLFLQTYDFSLNYYRTSLQCLYNLLHLGIDMKAHYKTLLFSCTLLGILNL